MSLLLPSSRARLQQQQQQSLRPTKPQRQRRRRGTDGSVAEWFIYGAYRTLPMPSIPAPSPMPPTHAGLQPRGKNKCKTNGNARCSPSCSPQIVTSRPSSSRSYQERRTHKSIFNPISRKYPPQTSAKEIETFRCVGGLRRFRAPTPAIQNRTQITNEVWSCGGRANAENATIVMDYMSVCYLSLTSIRRGFCSSART